MTLDEIVNGLSTVRGVIAVGIVDYGSGMVMAGRCKDPAFDFEIAAAGSVNIIRNKIKVMQALKIGDAIHDIQITLYKQYHLLCPCTHKHNAFIYMVADRTTANLSIIRRSMFNAEKLIV